MFWFYCEFMSFILNVGGYVCLYKNLLMHVLIIIIKNHVRQCKIKTEQCWLIFCKVCFKVRLDFRLLTSVFNNISVVLRSLVLLMEETRVAGETTDLFYWVQGHQFYYPPAIAVRDIVIAAVRPSHFLVYAIIWVNMDEFE